MQVPNDHRLGKRMDLGPKTRNTDFRSPWLSNRWVIPGLESECA